MAQVGDTAAVEGVPEDAARTWFEVDEVRDSDRNGSGSLGAGQARLRVLQCHAFGGIEIEQRSSAQIRFGVRFAGGDFIAGDETGEAVRRSAGDDCLGEGSVGHRDHDTRDAFGLELGQQLQGTGAERH